MMNRIERNITHTSPHKLLKSLMDSKERALQVQKECHNKIQKEKEDLKEGKIKCKSAATTFIKYLNKQIEMNVQSEFVYNSLIESIQNGDYVITKYDT
jgi:hypothetical protein